MPLHTRTLWQKIGIEYLSLYQNYWFHSIYTVTVYKNHGYIFSQHILVGETRLNCMLIQTYKFKYISLSTHYRNHSTFLYFIRKTQQTTRLTTSALLRYVRSARSQSRNLLDPFTAHGTACSRESWLVCTKLIKNVEQTRYPVKVTRVYHAKIALLNANEAGQSLLDIERNEGKRRLFYSCFGECRMFAYTISACEVRKLIPAYKIQCKSPSRWPDCLITINWFTVHWANLAACIWESAYVRSHVACGTGQHTLFLHVPQIFQRRKKRCK